MRLLTTLLLLCLFTLPVLAQPDSPPQREVAITIDDLPINSRNFRDNANHLAMTQYLVSHLVAYEVPAVGFVNEGKLYVDGTLDTVRVAMLRHWLDAGLDLGNHSFSHHDLHNTPLDTFQADILEGEMVTKQLLHDYGLAMRYFRHPYLHTGTDLDTKHALEGFLGEHDYRVAPVTIDNAEWIFALAYDTAAAQADSLAMQEIADAYVAYMDAKFAYFEQQSVALFGREIRQTLLIHANLLNANHFDTLAEMMLARGYTFITLERALEDEAYASPDTYTGRGGLTWLHRWAITRKVESSFFQGEPSTPAFILEAAGMESE
ncbi:MAG TPA: polysaccharide deacetylase family protein [Rhodothermales bacterium]|nr:polysaccharide deacetylase family protein [Rhodothermales bacterium]